MESGQSISKLGYENPIKIWIEKKFNIEIELVLNGKRLFQICG